jgi:hypothetical protein
MLSESQNASRSFSLVRYFRHVEYSTSPLKRPF